MYKRQVLGILRPENAPIIEAALSLVPSSYKILSPIKVKASDYGAATTRTRVFFIGYDPSRVAPLTESSFAPSVDIIPVKVKNALKGLPDVHEDWQTEKQSWRKLCIRDRTDTCELAGLVAPSLIAGALR